MTPIRFIALNVLFLEALHIGHHSLELWWWPSPLEALLGHHELGRTVHTTIEVLVVLLAMVVLLRGKVKEAK